MLLLLPTHFEHCYCANFQLKFNDYDFKRAVMAFVIQLSVFIASAAFFLQSAHSLEKERTHSITEYSEMSTPCDLIVEHAPHDGAVKQKEREKCKSARSIKGKHSMPTITVENSPLSNCEAQLHAKKATSGFEEYAKCLDKHAKKTSVLTDTPAGVSLEAQPRNK
jgi:hypothetical protein